MPSRPGTPPRSGSRVDGGHVGFVVPLAGRGLQRVESVELVGGEGDALGCGVLLDSCDAPGAGNRRDVLAAGEQPGQCGLGGGGAVLGADGGDLVDDGEVAAEVVAPARTSGPGGPPTTSASTTAASRSFITPSSATSTCPSSHCPSRPAPAPTWSPTCPSPAPRATTHSPCSPAGPPARIAPPLDETWRLRCPRGDRRREVNSGF
jgi:hypothetical protein